MPIDNRVSDALNVDALLTPDVLSTLMRSTWTWDDRALRRDLSDLLVRVDAANLVGAHDGIDKSIATALHAQARVVASGFVATVLGPKLVADTGNPLRSKFLDLAIDPVHFGKQAYAARRAVRATADDYFRAHAEGIDYAVESTWSGLVSKEGTAGLGTAMRAYGHSLSKSTFFASKALAWQAVSAVQRCGAASRYADRIQADELIATLAAAEETGSWDPALVTTRAAVTDGEWSISGRKHYVSGADAADVIFVIARSTAGPSLFAVDAGSTGLQICAHDVIDATRPLFEVTFHDTPATLLGVEGSGGKLMSTLVDRATTALAAEQVGLIEAAITVLRNTADRDDHRFAEVVLAHAGAHAVWQRALLDPSPEAAATAHIGCSAAAVHVATAVAELCDDDARATPLVLRGLSGSLLFGGPALSHERLLERLGI
ncbi:acyl-CoA dehydrogenase family protein [Mycobacterium sp. 050134]|uniref:acyl-CoA dehydrogenase family protein n=1 Tax=Mycobacterium sp. 050134 TaxID=3096111 RepID=UPI002ED84A8F